MAALISTILLLAVAYHAYRSGMRFLSQNPIRNPILERVLDEADFLPDTSGQAREGELSRQLFAGSLDPADYRQAMDVLAHSFSTQSGSTQSGSTQSGSIQSGPTQIGPTWTDGRQ